MPVVAANASLRERLGELVVSTAFTIVLIILHPWDAHLSQAQVCRPIAKCGEMCYSLYLLHWPITIVVTEALYRAGVRGVWRTLVIVAPLAILSSLIGSWLFHLLIERR